LATLDCVRCARAHQASPARARQRPRRVIPGPTFLAPSTLADIGAVSSITSRNAAHL